MSLALQDTGAATAPATVLMLRARVARRLESLFGRSRDGVDRLVAYHLGLLDEAGQPSSGPAGKLLRPTLLLLVAEAYGGSPAALDAAVAIELVHAFSLVHDDIEDGDRERRHRPTLWALHGIPLALNAGDSLFARAHRVLADACALAPPERAVELLRLFGEACLEMIEGQHLDLTFEREPGISLAQYEAMARRKTGALIGAALAMGACVSGAPAHEVAALRDAGMAAGLAFQAVDDGLAIWGDPAETGKAAGNDLARGKKSLPVVLAGELGLSVEAGSNSVRERVLAYATAQAGHARSLIAGACNNQSIRAEMEHVLESMVNRRS
jgi:geranylgeranyl diphosphate synthase type I